MDIILASERPPFSKLGEKPGTRPPKLVTPGEIIDESTNYIRGHGTYMENGNLIASVAGYVTTVNKLITVTPLRQVYQGAVGDTIVGRVMQVQTSRWKVDVNSRLDAELRLANIQLPGGEQRRKDLDDERGMRGLLQEGDLVCVEVQKIGNDGLLKLTARTSKFGKLTQGTLVKVSPSLIVQDKQRMQNLPCGARVIFGANGYIYITPIVVQDVVTEYSEDYEEVSYDVREIIGRLHNVIKLLANHSIMISRTSVVTAYNISAEQNVPVKELLKPDIMIDIALATVQELNE
ncbi:UNVERIFIED_CONTAM: hypothetical protein RMT77_005975 [Armadillidium vulgare]|nr:Exosome complex component RRP4 [Armadillidium vulgare]